MIETYSNRLPVDRKLLTRLFSKIQISTTHFYKDDPCWEWTASINNKGYGIIQFFGARRCASRVMYQLFVEIITPTTLECDHLCKHTQCVNPAHLEAVTPRENKIRSDSWSGINARKTHCDNGHEFNVENTYYAPSAPIERKCRACRTTRSNEFERQKRIRMKQLPIDDPLRLAYNARLKKARDKWNAKQKLLKTELHS